MKKYLWMLFAAVVIGALRVKWQKVDDKMYVCKFFKDFFFFVQAMFLRSPDSLVG